MGRRRVGAGRHDRGMTRLRSLPSWRQSAQAGEPGSRHVRRDLAPDLGLSGQTCGSGCMLRAGAMAKSRPSCIRPKRPRGIGTMPPVSPPMTAICAVRSEPSVRRCKDEGRNELLSHEPASDWRKLNARGFPSAVPLAVNHQHLKVAMIDDRRIDCEGHASVPDPERPVKLHSFPLAACVPPRNAWFPSPPALSLQGILPGPRQSPRLCVKLRTWRRPTAQETTCRSKAGMSPFSRAEYRMPEKPCPARICKDLPVRTGSA